MAERNAAPFDYRAEWEILLACGTPGAAETRAAQIEPLVSEDLNWDWLLRASLHHGMMPLLYLGLLKADLASLPDSVWQELEELYKRNVVRALWLSGELQECLNQLAAYGIAALPYKGPVLAAAAYGDVASRQYADLDILVRRHEALRARELLVSQGYYHELQLNAAQETAFLAAQSAYALTRPSGRDVLVELHWRFFEAYFSASLISEELWHRAVPLSLLGQDVLTPAPEDLLLVLCMHGTKHGWQRLGWVCDVAWLLSAYPELDWPAVQDRAREAGGLRMLHLGLRLAQDLFHAPLPRDVATCVQADVAARALARRVHNWYLNDVQPELPEARAAHPAGGVGSWYLHDAPQQAPWDTGLWRFHLQAKERRADRVRYVLRLAFTPTVGDWQAVALPSWLFPLYYLLRPFRLLAQYGL